MPTAPSIQAPSNLDMAWMNRAFELIQEMDPETLDTQVALTEIPAPPYAESARARFMATLLDDAGLTDVTIDEVGNVIGDLPGRSDTMDGTESRSPTGLAGAGVTPTPSLIVSAHLDTVFPAGTDVKVTREGDLLEGPGVSDDGRGLAALITVARVLREAEVRLDGDIRFVASVGEEGAGDLRGMKHLFSRSENREAGAFISLDGAGLGRIVTRGLGVRRLRLTVEGSGGHSWAARGTANPIHALADAVAAMEALDLPTHPPVGLTVARWGGGTSINAIPRQAWVEVDLRSESENYLRELDERVRRLAQGAVASHNAKGTEGEPLTLDVDVIGARPAGSTNPESALVQAAVDASRAVAVETELVASSTDSNIPMSLGIPAITMGAGGESGMVHTPDEWYRNRKGPEGILRALLTVVLFVGRKGD